MEIKSATPELQANEDEEQKQIPVLMIEVENVTHEKFRQTEEVKVYSQETMGNVVIGIISS